ncbi:hypothetical protein [Actibacterium sp. MT2.3-13A]|uniref:hypothetical protein n=1 Tax=Actibacterium sp. MT2.3-13A TaxID=2828332 RepID=UPI001BA70575|nr:hypothetical protein [Actibacterium sp. MT2.3-13A]
MFRIAVFLLLLTPALARAEDLPPGTPGAPGGMGGCDAEALPADADRGAWFYGQACLYCHGPASVLTSRVQGQTRAEKSAWLEALLSHHHCATDATIRADLIAYLLGL